MTTHVPVQGSLPAIIRNDDELYEGDLSYYFRFIFSFAQNLNHPYHNFRHMMHVMVMCYFACVYYRKELTPRQMRSLLIAALFHDFDHSGMMGNDDLNIARAIRGLDKYILQEDLSERDIIVSLMSVTEYPYKVESENLTLCEQIIRDADMAQSFDVAWIQQVVFGLAKEWGKKPLEVLKGQLIFTRALKFHTAWGQERFPQSAIDEKVAEIGHLIDLLYMPTGFP